uniref:Cation-transporting P-type ATPase C-terminal domain-containing protein n=1 Tax=Zooxanthella nutricula TaxID=1333877 RepID=A0A7S2J477_9DINO|mmetsp:Transcript_2587/g.7800  ORF Transcript_2587/g.7800 Transcript_2587/m.7800 type:complete len:382 (+) Transcript_2587:1-1146(+)
MGSGTVVAGHAADVTLRSDRLADMVAAVEEGRRAFANIGKIVSYWMSANIGELWINVAVVFFNLPKPWETMNQLVLGLAATSFGVFPLCFEPAEATVMRDAPRARNDSVVHPRIWRWIVVPFWLVFPTVTIGAMLLGLSWHVGEYRGQKIAELCSFAYTCREGGKTCIMNAKPYMCSCLALGTEQWGRKQTEQNNFAAQFEASSGISGASYSRQFGPWDTQEPLGPCSSESTNEFGEALPENARCWLTWAMQPEELVGADGRTTGDFGMVYENLLLDAKNCVRQGTMLAKTMGWNTILLTELAFLQCLRSPQSLLQTFTRNKTALVFLCVSVAIGVFIIYTPVVNTFFDLAPLGFFSFAITWIGAASVVVLAEGAKWLLRR